MDSIKIKPLNKADFEHWKNRTVRSETTEYWIDRAFRAEEAADKTAEELLRDMRKLYQRSYAEIEKEIQAFYGRYAEENGLSMQEVHRRLDPKQLKSALEEIKRYYEFADPKKIGKDMSDEYRDELRRLSARAYMSRLEEIKARLKYQMMKLAAEENKAFEDAMKKAYAEAHAQTSYTLDKGLGFSEGYSAPSEDILDKVVKTKWLGSNYSDRIWQDKGKLLTSIETELLSGIARGQNPRKIADAMAAKYGQDYKNCERLARTETIHYMNEAACDSYKEHGVEKYQFMCGLDERTCPTCGALDGTVHDVRYKEEGVNYPVMHPNCYDDKTEVLTRSGWKLFRECSDDDEYFSMNPDNPGETDYLKASSMISDRTLLVIEFRYGRKVVRVTENHDMLVKYGGKLHFMKAKNLLSLNSNAIGRDIFILDDKLEEIPLSDFSCTLEQGWFSVYCVELPKWHTLLVRRDGSTPVWCGNCRCTTVPYFEKDDIDAMFEEATRAAYDENHKIYDVPESMTYKEWLETIGSDQQKAILGKERYEMHVNGMPITDFVRDGKMIPLRELRTIQLAEKEFPGEKWIEKAPNIFVAQGRNITGKNEKEKFEKEFAQAKILATNKHFVYLVPEAKAIGHYDSIVDGIQTEFKTVTGGLNAVGHNYAKAITQGHDVFIRTSEKLPREIYSKLLGTTKTLLKENKPVGKGSVYIWLDEEQKLHKWKMEQINEKARKLLEEELKRKKS